MLEDIAALWSNDIDKCTTVQRHHVLKVMQRSDEKRFRGALRELMEVWAVERSRVFCDVIVDMIKRFDVFHVSHAMINAVTADSIATGITETYDRDSAGIAWYVPIDILWYISAFTDHFLSLINPASPPRIPQFIYVEAMKRLDYHCADDHTGLNYVVTNKSVYAMTTQPVFFTCRDAAMKTMTAALESGRVQVSTSPRTSGSLVHMPADTSIINVLFDICRSQSPSIGQQSILKSMMRLTKSIVQTETVYQRLYRHISTMPDLHVMTVIDSEYTCNINDLMYMSDDEIMKVHRINCSDDILIDHTRHKTRRDIFDVPQYVRTHVASLVTNPTYKYLYGGRLDVHTRSRMKRDRVRRLPRVTIMREREDMDAARAIRDGIMLNVICRSPTHHYFRAMREQGLLYKCYITESLIDYDPSVLQDIQMNDRLIDMTAMVKYFM